MRAHVHACVRDVFAIYDNNISPRLIMITRALLRLVWPASRLTRTPLARRRWKRLIHQRDVTI